MKNVPTSRGRRLGPVLLAVLGLLSGFGVSYAAGGNGNPPQPASDHMGAAVNDTAITAQVRSKLNGAERLHDSNITIETTNGVVTLTGSVKDAQAKDRAAQITRKVDGVKSVDNQLNVSGGAIANGEQAVSDSWITTKVKSKLMADNTRQALKVNVSTNNGVVTLKGALPNQQDVQHVAALARQVEGVKSVDDAALTASSR